MSTSDFRFFRVPEPILNPLTVIYLFRRKVTKPTIPRLSMYWVTPYLTPYFSKHSTGTDSWRVWPPSTRFWSQDHLKRSKMINQYQNWSKIVEIGQKLGVCRTKYFNPKSWVFLKNPLVDKWVSWGHFWSFRVVRGLYICIRHLPRALLVFLVVILASGAVFRPIFTHGVPRRTLEMSTHARSLTLRSSTEVIFVTKSYLLWLEMVGLGLWDANRALVWQNRSRIEFCGPKSVHDRDMVIFRLRIFIFL